MYIEEMAIVMIFGDKLEFRGECSAYCNPKSGVKGDASPLRVEGSALVAVRRNLRTKCGNSVRSTVTLRAGAQSKRPKALKGCGGKQEFSPTCNTLSLLSLSSETVRWTVSEAHYTAKL